MALSPSSIVLQTLMKQLFTVCSRRMVERYTCTGNTVLSWQSRNFSTERNVPPKRKKLYFLSTTMVQRENGIVDVPIIMKRIGDKVVEVRNNTESINRLTTDDLTFGRKLQDCETTGEVLQLLDMQCETVVGHSAVAALRKLEILDQKRRNTQSKPGKSFVSNTIMHELFAIVHEDTNTLTEDSLISLAKTFMETNEPKLDLIEHIFALIQVKMEDSSLSKDAVFSLIELWQSIENCNRELLQDLWLHLTSRYYELDIDDMLRYLEYVPVDMAITEKLLKIMEPHIIRCGWQLGGNGIGKMSTYLSNLNCWNSNLATSLAKWTLYHIHDIKSDDLMNVVHLFHGQNQPNSDLINALEKYICCKGDRVDNWMLCITMEYLCRTRYFSRTIMEAAAEHFIKRGDSYSASDLFYILKPFGYFNYVPKNNLKFFQSADTFIRKQFDNFSGADLFKLVVSFQWLGKDSQIFRTLCRTKCGTQKYSLQDYLWYKRAMMIKNQELNYFNFHVYFFKAEIVRKIFHIALEALVSLFDNRDAVRYNVVTGAFVVDFMLIVDKNKDVVCGRLPHVPTDCQMVLIKLQYPEHYCVNTGQLLGEHALAVQHFSRTRNTYITLDPFQEGIPQMNQHIYQMHLFHKLQSHVNLQNNPFQGLSEENLLQLWHMYKTSPKM